MSIKDRDQLVPRDQYPEALDAGLAQAQGWTPSQDIAVPVRPPFDESALPQLPESEWQRQQRFEATPAIVVEHFRPDVEFGLNLGGKQVTGKLLQVD